MFHTGDEIRMREEIPHRQMEIFWGKILVGSVVGRSLHRRASCYPISATMGNETGMGILNSSE
jgi:hypothetical protein